ncbi:MAG: hypothetical protein ACRD2L_03995 [Terriglobia bacterium]
MELKRAQDESRSGYVSPVYLATLYERLDERDDAIQQLQKAYENRDMRLIDLRVMPEFVASLHSDPRFKNLLQQMGLSQ